MPAVIDSCPGDELRTVGIKRYYGLDDQNYDFLTAVTACPAGTRLATFETQEELDTINDILNNDLTCAFNNQNITAHVKIYWYNHWNFGVWQARRKKRSHRYVAA